jgi:hypothetical protein
VHEESDHVDRLGEDNWPIHRIVYMKIDEIKEQTSKTMEIILTLVETFTCQIHKAKKRLTDAKSSRTLTRFVREVSSCDVGTNIGYQN